MAMFDGIVQDLIDELGRLPGVGPKSAQRIAFHILQTQSFDVSRLAMLLTEVRERVRFCEECGNLTESLRCAICADPRRDRTIICVVESRPMSPRSSARASTAGCTTCSAARSTRSPASVPDDLRIPQLSARLGDGTVTEVIIATDPNVVGEATASYLSRLLRLPGLTVTRLASGLPVGGDLEFADEITLGRAFSGRRSV